MAMKLHQGNIELFNYRNTADHETKGGLKSSLSDLCVLCVSKEAANV